MIRLTPLGWLFLVLAGLLYVASLTSNSGLLLLFIGLFAGCFLLNILYASAGIKHLKVTPPRSIQVSENEIPQEPWVITNTSQRPSGFAEISTPTARLVRVGTLAPGASTNVRPEFAMPRRGVYSFADCAVASSFPFGLLTVKRPLKLPGEVVVYPKLIDVDLPPASGFDVMVGGRFRGTRRVVSGTHFSGVRPLQPQDPLKNIHWKSSAKGRGLMVKTFDEELSGRIAIIADTGSQDKLDDLDESLRLAASLVFSSLDAGHHVEFIDVEKLKPILVPPFSDGIELLDRVARIQAGAVPLTVDVLESAVRKVSQRGSLVFTLTDCPPEIAEYIDSMRLRGRKVSLYLKGRKESVAEVLA